MKLLLDTHAFLWSLEASPHLSRPARNALAVQANEKFVSIASLWEITIKVAKGKLALQTPWEETLKEIPRRMPKAILPCTLEHLDALLRLPRHHGDPFDRLLVAQALSGGLTLVSNDDLLDDYGIQRLW